MMATSQTDEPSPQLSFQGYLSHLNSSTRCCRSASLLVPTAPIAASQSQSQAHKILTTLCQWKWTCDSVLIQPWQRRDDCATPASNSDECYFGCLPSDDDLLFLRDKYSQHDSYCDSLLPTTQDELVQFHLQHKSLVVPLTDDATAFILNLLFAMRPIICDGLCMKESDSDCSPLNLMDPSICKQALTLEHWICQRQITLIHNIDGNQTHSLSKERDIFPSTIISSAIPPKGNTHSFTFADLFAGIGGFRLAMEELGGKCIGSCEIDPHARWTYCRNFSTKGEFYVTDVARLDIPCGMVDVLCGGFPCQSFSTLADCSDVRKEMKHNPLSDRTRRRGGLETPKKGRLFFQLLRVLRNSQPKLFVFENVKGLVHLDGGSHFERILSLLRESGYHVTHGVVDTSWFLPQRRERVFFVGVRLDLLDNNNNNNSQSTFTAFSSQEIKQKYQIYDNDIRGDGDRFDRVLERCCEHSCVHDGVSRLKPSRLGDILESNEAVLTQGLHAFLTPHQWKKVLSQRYTQIHLDGSGRLVTEDDSCAQTLVSSYRKSPLMHSQFVVPRGSMYLQHQNAVLTQEAHLKKQTWGATETDEMNKDLGIDIIDGEQLPRFFTPRECCRLQGFPEHFILPSDEQYTPCFYRQIGNSVSPPCVIAVVQDMVNNFLIKKD